MGSGHLELGSWLCLLLCVFSPSGLYFEEGDRLDCLWNNGQEQAGQHVELSWNGLSFKAGVGSREKGTASLHLHWAGLGCTSGLILLKKK